MICLFWGARRSLRACPAVGCRGILRQPTSIGDVLGGLDFDVIYHVASLPGDTGDPLEMVTVNMLGLTHLLVHARDTGVKRFVLSSSVSAYEWYPATTFVAPDYMPVDENHPARPKDMYASTKRMQEVLALTFHHQYGLPVDGAASDRCGRAGRTGRRAGLA